MAASDKFNEKYCVQVQTKTGWHTQLSFDLDQRHIAMEEAKRLTLKHPQIPVRILFESYNSLTKHNSQAIIYRSEAMLENLREKKKHKRIPLSLGEYIVAYANILLMCIITGFGFMAVAHFTINSMYLFLEEITHQLVLMAVFSIAFLGVLYVGANYLQSRYYYEKRKRKPLFAKEKKTYWPTDPEPVKSPVDVKVQHDMENAARAISYMPVNDHKRTNLSEYEKMPEAEVLALFKPNEEKKPVPLSDDEQTMSMLEAFSQYCQISMERAQMPITSDNLYGFCIYLMGAMEACFTLKNTKETHRDKIARSFLIRSGLKGNPLEQFMLDYESRLDNQIDYNLFNKGQNNFTQSLSADSQITLDIAPAIQKWRRDHIQHQLDQKRPYVLTCHLTYKPITEEEYSGENWPTAWANFLGQFTSYIFDGSNTTLSMDFKTSHGVLEAATIIRQSIQDFSERVSDHKIEFRSIITHEQEDEIIGETGLKLVSTLPEGKVVFTESVFGSLKKPELLGFSQKGDYYFFEEFIEEDTQKDPSSSGAPLQLQAL